MKIVKFIKMIKIYVRLAKMGMIPILTLRFVWKSRKIVKRNSNKITLFCVSLVLLNFILNQL